MSSEELQTLWGRTLAGEIKSPGSYSLRTLDFLKNLSHKPGVPDRQACHPLLSTTLQYFVATSNYWKRMEYYVQPLDLQLGVVSFSDR